MTSLADQLDRIQRENKFVEQLVQNANEYPELTCKMAAEQKIPLTFDTMVIISETQKMLIAKTKHISEILATRRKIDHKFDDNVIQLRQMIFSGGMKNASDMIRATLLPTTNPRQTRIDMETQKILICDVLLGLDPTISGVLFTLPNNCDLHVTLLICDKGAPILAMLTALRFALDNANSPTYGTQPNKDIVVAMVKDIIGRLKNTHGDTIEKDLRAANLLDL